MSRRLCTKAMHLAVHRCTLGYVWFCPDGVDQDEGVAVLADNVHTNMRQYTSIFIQGFFS